MVCVLGVVLGLGLVLIGLLANLIALSVVGFVLVVGAFGYGAQSLRSRGSSAPVPQAGSRRSDGSGGFRSRMEARMRRRFDEN